MSCHILFFLYMWVFFFLFLIIAKISYSAFTFRCVYVCLYVCAYVYASVFVCEREMCTCGGQECLHMSSSVALYLVIRQCLLLAWSLQVQPGSEPQRPSCLRRLHSAGFPASHVAFCTSSDL